MRENEPLTVEIRTCADCEEFGEMIRTVFSIGQLGFLISAVTEKLSKVLRAAEVKSISDEDLHDALDATRTVLLGVPAGQREMIMAQVNQHTNIGFNYGKCSRTVHYNPNEKDGSLH